MVCPGALDVTAAHVGPPQDRQGVQLTVAVLERAGRVERDAADRGEVRPQRTTFQEGRFRQREAGGHPVVPLAYGRMQELPQRGPLGFEPPHGVVVVGQPHG